MTPVFLCGFEQGSLTAWMTLRGAVVGGPPRADAVEVALRQGSPEFTEGLRVNGIFLNENPSTGLS